MSLTERLIARIAREGAISVADYMDVCLHDPEAGYYACRPALGAQGLAAKKEAQATGHALWLGDGHAGGVTVRNCRCFGN